jgi:hypothetical protein
MKRLKVQTIIRIILSLFMIYMIYRETGFFTALFAFTMMIYVELDSYQKRKR